MLRTIGVLAAILFVFASACSAQEEELESVTLKAVVPSGADAIPEASMPADVEEPEPQTPPPPEAPEPVPEAEQAQTSEAPVPDPNAEKVKRPTEKEQRSTKPVAAFWVILPKR